ncbi:MAG: DinB family protein [Chloroflexi bacterium]|nr:MAG: DinB family protein [Chloroflexota bacterium]MBL1196187.1 DinB family protein [Chloroflexota bacterium]NOH13480.1 DinB family protein [Chloroflexota bacterium]
MPHPLVTQLRFARSELQRCLADVSAEDAVVRIGPMNSISWIVGHLANQEHFYWVRMATGENLVPDLNDLVGTGKPASTPPLDEMWDTWRTVTQAADVYLDTLTSEVMLTHFEFRGKTLGESVGTQIQRTLYHYWFHTGEAHAIRQQLGHTDLPEFVGSFGDAVFKQSLE